MSAQVRTLFTAGNWNMTAKIGSKKNVTLGFINWCVVMGRKLKRGGNKC